MKRIKVMRIIARINIGGPAIHTILLTEGLNRDLFDSLLVTGNISSGESDMFYLADKKGVKPIIIPELARDINFKNDLVAFLRLYQAIRENKPDIVHTHTAKAGFLGRLAAILAGVPCRVHTFHGHIFDGYFSRIKSAIFVLMEKILSWKTDVIIAVSPAVKKQLLRYGIANPDKIVVIPLGLELDGLLGLGEKEDSQFFNIGIVGRLTKIKNHKLFFDAARELQLRYKKGRELKFIVIGDGELKENLREYVENIGLSGVEFMGWVKDSIEIYKDLDIVALTSINEGTPVSLIEAMAAARAVIATDVGGVKDLVEPVCKRINLAVDKILIGSGDTQGLANAMSFLIDDEQLRRGFGIAGRNFVKERFTKERLISDIEKLYNNYF